MALAMQRPPISFGRETSSLTLEELVGEARDSFAGELAIPMTVHQPPVIKTKDAHGDVVYEPTESTQVGMLMSSQLQRRVAAWPASTAHGYGNVFPVARALDDLRGWCRGRHLEARSGPWLDHAADVALGAELQRPLCARLGWFAVAWRMQPAWSARQERLPMPVVRRLLMGAMKHMWDQRREWAHDGSGATEVMAAQRRERREARQRAAASATVRCRRCSRPFDPRSIEPCPEQESSGLTQLYPGAAFLCVPGELE